MVVIFSNALFDYGFAKYDYHDDIIVVKYDYDDADFAPRRRKCHFRVTGSETEDVLAVSKRTQKKMITPKMR